MPVSILTRPVGRVQQSSSSNHHPTYRVSILTRPVGRVQLVQRRPSRGGLVSVSILTRPVGRVQPFVRSLEICESDVSILTRPVGRVQPIIERVFIHMVHLVSILTRPVGRVQRPRPGLSTPPRYRFNPHPARRPSATPHRRHLQQRRAHVSILTRPVGRVQLPYPFFLLVHREPPQPRQGVSTFCST